MTHCTPFLLGARLPIVYTAPSLHVPAPPPQVNCVYQSDDAQNEFLSNPKIGLGEDVYDKVNKAPYDPAADDL